MPKGKTIVDLKDATLVLEEIVAINKGVEPATVHTLPTPFIVVHLKSKQTHLILVYENYEERDKEYELLRTLLHTVYGDLAIGLDAD